MSRQFELGKAPPGAPGTNLKTLENPTMSDNMNKGFDQVAAFQKLWTDSFANMTDVWSQFSPGSPPSDEIRKMRGGMLKVLAETWDEYMRTPQFMEMMKASMNGALDLKRMARDGMNRVHEQFETPSKEDIDGVLLAIRHVEGRLLDRLEGLDDRVVNLNEKIDKIDQRIAKQEHAIDERVANLNEKIDKVDERTAQRKNAIQRRGQTSKTKAQKPEATTGAKHSLDK
jgi:hypothetical protein